MFTSKEFTNVAKALLAAQKEMGHAVKDSKNPFFKSNYADLNSVLDASKDVLNKHGITILQPHASNEGNEYVETVLLHESGEWLASTTKIEVAKQNDPQALGSAITYARRYGLSSMLGMGAEDDDAEGAMARNKKADYKAVAKTVATSAAETKSVPAVESQAHLNVAGTQQNPNQAASVTNITTPAPKAKTSFRKAAAIPALTVATGSNDDII